MSRLEGRRVVLTGAAGGLGALLADRLHARGAWLIGVDRGECPACDESRPCDLADPAALDRLAAALAGTRVDILLNVAGVQYFGPVERQGGERIRLGYAVNLVAPAVLSAALVPQMLARGDGQIANIGSMLGAVPYPYFSTYSSAKCGLKGLSQALRRELRGSGVTITHVSPRAVRTPLNTPAIERFMAASGMTADQPEKVADRIMAAIEGRAADVSIGVAERLFAMLNTVAPRLIDRGLSGAIKTARGQLSI